MFKELFILISLLFKSKPSGILGKDLEIITMKHFPFKGYRYMSWCGKVVTRSEKEGVIKRFLTTRPGKVSQTHEYGHAVQAESEHGDNWFRYYLSYFWNWLMENPFSNPSSSAYFTNRYEVEAYAKEEDANYWANYNRSNLRGKYSIKGAKNLYRKLGGTPNAWKSYIKML